MDKTLVKDIMRSTARTLTAKEGDAIESAIKQFVHQPEVHTFFIIDEKKKLKGVVKLHYVLNWVKLKLGMDVANRSNMRVAGTAEAFEIMRLCQSQTIGDILSPVSTIKPDNTLEQALHVMVHEQMMELPVVDDADKLLGEVKLTQLLERMLETTSDKGPVC